MSVFGAVTGTPPGPNSARSAAASSASACGTPEASAKTTSISSGRNPASARARSMVRRSTGGRSPPGAGSKPAA